MERTSPWRTETKRYGCFISYRHGIRSGGVPEKWGDSAFASAIHVALHRIARPWWKIRAIYLLLVASPEAARSSWVAKEVRHWLGNDNHAERVIVVVTAGVLHWNESAGALDSELTNCIPPQLATAITREPNWVDARNLTAKTQYTLDNAVFRRCVIKIAARIHGCSPEDIDGEDAARRRQVIRALASGLVAMGVLAAVAWVQRSNSVRMQARAEAGLSFSQAQAGLERRPRDAAALVTAGVAKLIEHRIQPASDAILAARRSADAIRDVVHWTAATGNVRSLVSRAEELLITGDDMVMQLRKQTGVPTALPLADMSDMPLGAVAADYDPSSDTLLVIAKDLEGRTRWHRMMIQSNKREARNLASMLSPTGIAHYGTGESVVSSKEGKVLLLDERGNEKKEIDLPNAGAITCSTLRRICIVGEILPTQFGNGVDLGTSIERNSRLFVISMESGRIETIESPHVAIAGIALKDGIIWSVGSEGLAQRYEIRDEIVHRDGEPLRVLDQPATAIAFDGSRLAVGSRTGLIRVWRGGVEYERELRGHLPAVVSHFISPLIFRANSRS